MDPCEPIMCRPRHHSWFQRLLKWLSPRKATPPPRARTIARLRGTNLSVPTRGAIIYEEYNHPFILSRSLRETMMSNRAARYGLRQRLRSFSYH